MSGQYRGKVGNYGFNDSCVYRRFLRR
jgi:hypothetical protein